MTRALAVMALLLMSKKGTKCITTYGNRVVAAACSGGFEQAVSPNFAVGGLQIGAQCLRRSNWDLTLAECHAGDPNEAFAIDVTTREITNASGPRACISLKGEWQVNEKVGLEPCDGGSGRKWLTATITATAPPNGRAKTNDTVGDVQPGDYVRITSGPFNGQFLVVK